MTLILVNLWLSIKILLDGEVSLDEYILVVFGDSYSNEESTFGDDEDEGKHRVRNDELWLEINN